VRITSNGESLEVVIITPVKKVNCHNVFESARGRLKGKVTTNIQEVGVLKKKEKTGQAIV